MFPNFSFMSCAQVSSLCVFAPFSFFLLFFFFFIMGALEFNYSELWTSSELCICELCVIRIPEYPLQLGIAAQLHQVLYLLKPGASMCMFKESSPCFIGSTYHSKILLFNSKCRLVYQKILTI